MGPKDATMDEWLRKYLDNYDQWLDTGRIDYSSRVVPINRALDTRRWVLPTAQVLQIVKDAQVIGLAHCVCRTHYRRCGHPAEVCLLLNDFGRKHIENGRAREISFEEAGPILETADRNGLVHMSLYRPDRQLYALCSCCPCCCHDLQLLLAFGQKRLVTHADYVAVTEEDACAHCGECIDICPFGARTMEEGELRVDLSRCYGCGVCVPACADQAISLMVREGIEYPAEG